MTFLYELKKKKLIKNITNFFELEKCLNEKITLYCGIDPTSSSLHIGHLQLLILLKRFHLKGNKIIILIGNGTAMIGDPKNNLERKILSNSEIKKNTYNIKKQIKNFFYYFSNKKKFSLSKKNIFIIKNYDWLKKITMLEFLRNFGKKININQMLSKKIISKRLKIGISYAEFSYSLLQAIDFLKLYKKKKCILQIGGSDQWGNILNGIKLIQKIENNKKLKIFGLTIPLIVNEDGEKISKTIKNNISINKKETDIFSFYQYFYNISDKNITDYIYKFSLRKNNDIKMVLNKIKKYPKKRFGQNFIAEELTKLIYGKKMLKKLKKFLNFIFYKKKNVLSVKDICLLFKNNLKKITNKNINIVNALIKLKIVTSKRSARQLIFDNAIRVNNFVIKNEKFLIMKKYAFKKKISIICRGKKFFYVLLHL